MPTTTLTVAAEVSMTAPLKLVKPSTVAEKATRTTSDTLAVTPETVNAWKKPPFQRAFKNNEKVQEIAEEIADTEVIPGVLTLGVLNGETYLIDGQHRREAFLMSGLPKGYVDVRTAHYKSMAEMSKEFDRLNSSISKMKPDDRLRAMEFDSDNYLAALRKACPFVGYDNIRRGEGTPLLSMGTTIRCWNMSAKEVPISGGGASKGGIAEIAKRFSKEDSDLLSQFLNTAHSAWGTDREYHRLWGNLNLTICMWLYRRLVITGYSAKSVRISLPMFQKCLIALSANESYVEWLHGRNSTDRTRAPAYKKVKDIFSRRINEETGNKPKLPQPKWSNS